MVDDAHVVPSLPYSGAQAAHHQTTRPAKQFGSRWRALFNLTKSHYFFARYRNRYGRGAFHVESIFRTAVDMDKDAANEFLSSLLNQNLAVTATDGRLFWGQFKCTDAESNIVLAQTYEYRPPSEEMRAQAATQAMGAASVTLDMTSRYLGLVVVPGHRITKVEVERFASQVRQQKGQAVI